MIVLAKADVRYLFGDIVYRLDSEQRSELEGEIARLSGYFYGKSDVDPRTYIDVMAKAIEKEMSNGGKYDVFNLHAPRSHVLLIDSDLRNICERTVAEFGNTALEWDRSQRWALKLILERQKGERVKWVQEQLNTSGFYDGPIDGTIGPKTKDALKKYQASKGLSVTGEVDDPTRHSLDTDRFQRAIEQFRKKKEEINNRQKP
jgi:hypothetical protein